MVKQLVPDELWMIIEPLLPPEPPKPNGGRPRLPDRAALAGIIYVLKSGIPWEKLAKELGFGSGVTCWRRLRDWQKAGMWRRSHRVLLDELSKAGPIEWSRASHCSKYLQNGIFLLGMLRGCSPSLAWVGVLLV